MNLTDGDFDRVSWHDCHVWALELRAGDADEQDWTSDLLLRLDYIVEWICGIDGGGQFRVAPAELIFHDVTDARVSITWAESGNRLALHLLSIDQIERTPVPDRHSSRDLPYYRWRIRLNWPQGGEITFGAARFTQSLLAEPVLTDLQHLTRKQRSALLLQRLRESN